MSKKGDKVEVIKRDKCVIIRVNVRDGSVRQVVVFDEDVLTLAANLVSSQEGIKKES